MRIPLLALAATLAAAPFAPEAGAKTFRFATTSDAATLDPHANNAFFTYLITGQIYEPLIDRGDDLKITPGLALRWEQVGGTFRRAPCTPRGTSHSSTPFGRRGTA